MPKRISKVTWLIRLHKRCSRIYNSGSMKPTFLIAAVVVCLGARAETTPNTIQDVVARMDRAAVSFQAMRANVNYLTHTAVIDDDTKESGSVLMRKVPPNEVQGRIDFVLPDPRTVTFEQRKAQVYYPKIKTLQIYDLGDKGEQLDRFLMIGFGTSGTELAKEYGMRVVSSEQIKGQTAIKLELLPKSADIRNVVTKIEMWIPEVGDPYPVQEKIYEKSPGDFRLINYSEVQLNPKLKPDALKLKLPSGVKTVTPQK